MGHAGTGEFLQARWIEILHDPSLKVRAYLAAGAREVWVVEESGERTIVAAPSPTSAGSR